MAIAKGANTPKKGMNRSSARFEITDSEYTFAFNANFHDEHGTGKVNLQNEPSNIYCSGFKDGYKVVGHKYHMGKDVTYFFLANPETGFSEIGYISSFQNPDSLEAISEECGCNIKVILENPLEDSVQEATCAYITIVSDFCNIDNTYTGCLNFTVDSPIKESNIIIKEELTGTNLYWTDGTTPRYVQLDNLDIYTQDIDDCTGVITETCFQCDKLRIFPLFDKLCLRPRAIQAGGNLRAGAYEALAAYCDAKGNELSDYYSKTNLINIHDPNNNILDQTDLDYLTNLAIGIDISDQDTNYAYYKLVVIYRSGLDSTLSSFEYGIYPIDTEKITISTLVDKPRIDLADLISRRAIYQTAQGFAEGNGYMFQYGLTAHREINLQPVMNLAGAFAEWNTVIAKENLYTDGVGTANYRSYMRDEVSPFSIKLYLEGGYETPNFVLVPRPPYASEIEVVGSAGFPDDSNIRSVTSHNPICSEQLRDKRWQFENTATIEGQCLIAATGDTVDVIRDEELSCFVEDAQGAIQELTTINTGTLTITTNLTLAQYINSNITTILAETDPQWSVIQNILNNPGLYPGVCDPAFPDNCGAATVVSEEMLAIGTASEIAVTEVVAYADQTRIHEPDKCYVFLVPNINDDAFVDSYMKPGSSVTLRTDPHTNTNCGAASIAVTYINATIDNFFHLQNIGGTGAISSIQTTYSSSAISAEYTDKVHTNALWYKVALTQDVLVFEVSRTDNLSFDDNSGSSIRITVFDGCVTSDMPAYSRIVTSVSSFDDINKYVELVAADFTGTEAIIAIDSPVITEAEFRTVVSAGGITAIIIAGTTYPVVYNTDPETTVDDFVAAEQANILANHGMEVFDDGDAISIYTDPADLALISVTNGLTEGITTSHEIHRLTPPSGCMNTFVRDSAVIDNIDFTDLTFGKRVTYTSACSYSLPVLTDCDPQAHQHGEFSYWESEIKYPCNGALYNSSDLAIVPADIPTSIATKFEAYFSNGLVGGLYDLNAETDLRDSPIKHYKFPDSTLVPFMSPYSEAPADFAESVIYPIGFTLSPEVIRAFLDIAVKNGLLTLEERNRITKYEIFKGDRSIDKSVIAKGLLFDMYEYDEEDGGKVHYPNYPLNSMGNDIFNGGVPHRGNSTKNNMFTFHSPDTSFYKPTLPGEMTIEGYQLGNSETFYDVVEDHPTFVILAPEGFVLATTLAITEVAFELLIQGLEYGMDGAGAGTLPGAVVAVALAIALVIALIAGMFRVGELRYQWIDTLRNLGHPEQFAYYSATTGFYNRFLPNTESGSRLRGLASKSYIKEGRWKIAEEITGTSLDINNQDRSDSVFLGLGDTDDFWINYPSLYTNWDNRNLALNVSSNAPYPGVGRSPSMRGRTASPYVALKQYLPSQYGSIASVNWLSTGHCGEVNKVIDCEPVFGGDTYISRFSPKRKFPYFTSNAHGLAPLTPYKYSGDFNINNGLVGQRTYIDYLINSTDNDYTVAGLIFPTNKSEYNFYSQDTLALDIYIKPPAKFFLFSYGFPHFLVESVFNSEYRYAKREAHENFYPNIKDTLEFTQESNVSIRQPNTYFYNFVYSAIPTRTPWRMLPGDYDATTYEKLSDLSNTIIYSGQDKSENNLSDPWLTYKPLDAYHFPTSQGKLIDVDGIESEQMLGRFENGITIFGAIDVLRDRLTPDVSRLGSGGIFSGRNISFNKTDLGYGGTQHTAKVSCEFGHFWADAKRGEVFNLSANGKGLEQITEGMEEWFREHLPFKILREFPEIPIDELDKAVKGLGLTMAWDARSKRVFLTKLDYKVVEGKEVTYQLGSFYGNVPTDGSDGSRPDPDAIGEVFLTDTEFFTDCSFTVAYSPLTKSWISYYSFKPNYYIGYEGYFQTGKNFSADESEIGVWSHLPFLSSYQVFYGKLQPFIIEYALPTKGTNSTLHDISYWLDVRKYYNKYDVADIYGYGYNKAYIYNNYQNTGQLNLVHRKNDDLSQELDYPNHNSNSIDILQSEVVGEYTFNHLYNAVKSERSGIPIWINDTVQVLKTTNQALLDMTASYKDRLKGDHFLVRLEQDVESRYKMIHRFSTDKRDFR